MWPFSKRKRDQELDEEIRAHLAMAAQDRIQRGQAERDAALDARAALLETQGIGE